MSNLFIPERMVQTARYYADINYHEGWANQNVFSDWQYNDSHEPWCDSFVCYAAYQGGFRFPWYWTFGEKGDNNVQMTAIHAQRGGIWRPRGWIAPPSSFAIFSWNEPYQHIEMVLSDQGGGSFATIGGNTGDACKYRIRYRANTVGFVDLIGAGQLATNPPVKKPVDPTVVGVNMKATDRTDAVHTPSGGNLVLQADGGVFAYNGATFHGAIPGTSTHLNLTNNWAASICLTPSTQGYWVLTAGGAIYSFGDAKYHGGFQKSTNAKLDIFMVQLVPDATRGYIGIRSNGTTLAPGA